jgi:radical SAM superfamily enzyme YgiQ (UPF0313 family)
VIYLKCIFRIVVTFGEISSFQRFDSYCLGQYHLWFVVIICDKFDCLIFKHDLRYILIHYAGCNEGCTYCVVPGTRGREQSRLPEAIRRAILALGEAGYFLNLNIPMVC